MPDNFTCLTEAEAAALRAWWTGQNADNDMLSSAFTKLGLSWDDAACDIPDNFGCRV
jgi:hypothetical protein